MLQASRIFKLVSVSNPDDVMYQKRLDQRFPSAAVPVVPGGKDANQAVSKLKDQPSKDHSKPALVEVGPFD